MTDELEAIGKGFFMNSVPEGTAAPTSPQAQRRLVKLATSAACLDTLRLGWYRFPVPEAADFLVQGPASSFTKFHKAILLRCCRMLFEENRLCLPKLHT